MGNCKQCGLNGKFGPLFLCSVCSNTRDINTYITEELSSTGQPITSHVYTNFTNKIKFVNGKKIKKPNRFHSLFVKVTKKVATAGNMVVRQILNSQRQCHQISKIMLGREAKVLYYL